MNFAEALNLICGRCKRDKGTCKTCPVLSVAEEHDSEANVERQIELIRSLKYTKENNWYIGTIGGYPFQCKVATEDSAWGIDNGRIIKLLVTAKPTETDPGNEEIISYERGWILYPENDPELEDVLDALYEYFQNHSDEEIWTGGTTKWILLPKPLRKSPLNFVRRKKPLNA